MGGPFDSDDEDGSQPNEHGENVIVSVESQKLDGNSNEMELELDLDQIMGGILSDDRDEGTHEQPEGPTPAINNPDLSEQEVQDNLPLISARDVDRTETSLFIPQSPTRSASIRPTFDRNSFDVSSPTPGPSTLTTSFDRSSATPGPSTQASSSRMAPPPAPTSRTPKSMFSRIRNLQKQVSQNKLSASKPTRYGDTLPDNETYLDAIISRGHGQQPSVEISTVDTGEKADQEALAKYQKLKSFYEELIKSNGKLSFAQDVAWMKIRSAETSRKQKRKRDLDMARQEDGELDLFPTAIGSGSGSGFGNAREKGVSGFDHTGSTPRQESTGRTFTSLAEAEVQSMQVALQADGDNSRKKRKGARMPEAAKAVPPGKGKGRGGRSRGSKSKADSLASSSRMTGGIRKTGKDKKAMQSAIRMGTSLLTSDVFRQQAAEDAPEQPTFSSRRKDDALKELIASVPTEHQKSAKDDTAALLRATKDFDGRGSCKADGNGMWKVKGMASCMKHYQIMGTAFMRRRENDPNEPRGGLLADQMGLGKTIMMLANIVNGRGNNDQDCKTTLLIASPALITQWAREVELHTDAGLVVMRYSAGARIDSNHTSQVLKLADIVLTTYHEICRSYPKNEPPIECQTAEQKIAWWQRVYDTERGPLHRMIFHRIVLDEAQAIKNHLSRTSIACRALMARHKWALSGTPILNSLDELYSYFKFLGVPHTGSFKIFKNNYTDPKEPEHIERLLVRLAQFMLRRDHSDIMMNAPILKLPRASQMTHWCDFNSVERSVYNIVRDRFVRRINLSSKRGELEHCYNNALVMLLRLRQLTAHILMLQLVVQDLLEQEDIEKIRAVVEQEATDQRSSKGQTIRAIRRQLEALEAEAKRKPGRKMSDKSKPPQSMPLHHHDADEEQLDIEDLLDDSQDTDGASEQNDGTERLPGGAGKSFGKVFDFRRYLESLTIGDNWERVRKKAVCSDCGGRPTNAWLTSCGHLMCGKCYETTAVRAAEEDRMNGTCKGCGNIFTHANEVQEREVNAMSMPTTRSKKKLLSKELQRIEQEDVPADWLNFGSGPMLPSAKTIALKAQLLNWIKENAGVKIIIYTQFLAMIRIIQKICEEEHWKTEQYHGKMSHKARDDAIKHFAEDGSVRVLLASLRCGGLGLNLTMASRVVILDPWWNAAAEQQAFCRVFRYGQTEPTFLTRFCVKTSVDERLVEMQERKQAEIDSVMKEDAAARASKMSIRDLMRLFGNLEEDENGRPFILIDNPDRRGGFHADGDHEGFADEL